MIFAQKVNKIFEFHVIFARKIPEFQFYVIIARKIFFPHLGGTFPIAPVSYAYACRSHHVAFVTSDSAMDTTTAAAATDTLPDEGPNSTVSSCPRESGTPGCVLYTFIVSTVFIGLLAVFGSIGNVVSFVVFYRDKIKTSTTFLFQVVFRVYSMNLGDQKPWG